MTAMSPYRAPTGATPNVNTHYYDAKLCALGRILQHRRFRDLYPVIEEQLADIVVSGKCPQGRCRQSGRCLQKKGEAYTVAPTASVTM
jgi:hypothetical protein